MGSRSYPPTGSRCRLRCGRGACRAVGPELLACAPDPEDQDLGTDEEDDETLDEPREIRGAIRVDDRVRDTREPVRGSVQQSAEQEGAEEHPDRGVPAEERDGDADE